MPRLRTAASALVAVVACLFVPAHAVHAATPLMALRAAPDITLVLSGTTVTPADVAEDDFAGSVTLVNIGNIPADVHVDAYQLLPNGDQLLSFDTTVTLPGALVAAPADVVRFNGTNYAIAFDAAANGIPEGVNTDAVAVSDGDLLLSFDTAVRFGGTTFEDEDLVRVTSESTFAPFFTGAAAGVPSDLDLDGAQVLTAQRLLVSFDGSGTIGDLNFNDDDVLEYDAGTNTFELAFRGSAEHPNWADADLVAFYALVVPPSPTATATPSPSVTGTVPPTNTPTGTVVQPATPTDTPSQTPEPTGPTPTGTPTPETTATATPTHTPTATATPNVTTTPIPCIGDCDGDGTVTVSELITMVNIALGSTPVADCLAGDVDGGGEITIDEIVTAVNNALKGC